MASTYTQSECTDLFLDAVAAIVSEQATAVGISLTTRLNNLASGILLLIDQGDGGSGMPAYILAPNNVPATMQYQFSLGEDTWPTADLCEGVNISGELSSQFEEGI